MFPLRAFCGVLALSIVAGCGGESPPPLAKVHGKVTYKNEPLKTGTVLFVPQKKPESGGREYPSSGAIKPDGTYVLTTVDEGDGAPVGDHKVVVIAVDGGPAMDEKAALNSEAVKGVPAKAAKIRDLIPSMYSSEENTPLSTTVKAGEDNVFNIDIPK